MPLEELPEWVETVKGLVGGVLGTPVRLSKAATLRAAYVPTRFGAVVAEVCRLGIATPLRDLADSQLQRIREENISAAKAAHNKRITDRKMAEAQVERERAEAEKTRAEAREIHTRSSIERGRLELERMEAERRLAAQRAEETRARVEAAITTIKLKGGAVYLPDDHEEYPQPPGLGEGSTEG